jgi:tetratricopeptide (TPR) repeat protein
MRFGTLLFLIIALAAVDSTHGQTFSELIARGNALYEQGAYEASATAYEKAFELERARAIHYYNAACSWSLSGNADKAYEMLGVAIDRGYRDTDWLRTDEDLNALHDDPRWDAIVTRCREAEEAYLESINVELYEMFQADQSDRRGDIDWEVVTPRDEARRKRVLELIEAGLLEAPDDFVHAAFIFQHGSDSTSYRMAHELAMKAVALDSTYARARWIAAASKDRYLQSVGLPQIYGTQFRRVDGLWTLEPIDTTAVSDIERERWGVAPLAQQRAKAAKMNAD